MPTNKLCVSNYWKAVKIVILKVNSSDWARIIIPKGIYQFGCDNTPCASNGMNSYFNEIGH